MDLSKKCNYLFETSSCQLNSSDAGDIVWWILMFDTIWEIVMVTSGHCHSAPAIVHRAL